MDTPEAKAEKRQRIYKKFLSTFLKPMDLARLEEFDNWSPVLGEPLEKTCDRLVRQGFLQPATLAEKIAYRFNGNQLKQFLKDRGLPVSGKKASQAERLVEADSETFAPDLANYRVFLCSEKGAKVATAFLDKEEVRAQQACAEIHKALKKGDIDGAITIMRSWDVLNAFPQCPEETTDFAAMNRRAQLALQAEWPGLLELPEEMVRQLRLAVAMGDLMRSANPLTSIPEEYPISEKHRWDNDVKSIWKYVQYESMSDHFIGNSFREVDCTLLVGGCNPCEKISGQKLKIKSKEYRPWRNCINRNLCEWMIGPDQSGDGIDPDDPDSNLAEAEPKPKWNIFSWFKK